jgi:DNA-binding transcriptional LysR family regulator
MDYLGAIRVFIRAAELGSFSRVADELAIKTSSVSRTIAALESDLGAALFNRSTRRLHLTEAGAHFYERALRISAEVEEARAAISVLNGRPQGLLRINVPGAFGRRHIVPLLGPFLAEYPEIRIDATLTDATVDLIQAGADVAVRIGALADSNLVAKKLAPHRRVLCASPHYLARASRIERPEDIAQQACLTFALQPADRWYLSRGEGAGEERLDVAVKGPFRANDSEALLDAALSGIGIALLPTWLVGADLRDARLVQLLPEWEATIAQDSRAIWGVYPPKKVVSPKVRAFLDFLEKRFGRPPYWDLPA